jgi:hypothetical protein
MTRSAGCFDLFESNLCRGKVPFLCQVFCGSHRLVKAGCQFHELFALFDMLMRFGFLQIGDCHQYLAGFRLDRRGVAFIQGGF